MSKRKLSLRWLGSLSNLSTRRSSFKANTQAAPEHDGSLCGAKPAAAGEKTVDDMESCLHNPSYARSSDMYTHVGTVPRSERKKSFRGLKEKKKRREEEEEDGGVSGGQGQCKAGEHVPDSLLLSALSSLTLTSPDRPLPVSAASRPLPATPTPSRASPLTSGPDGFSRPPGELDKSQDAPSRSKDALETSRPVKYPPNMATNGPKVVPAQDVYVPMDPITEAARDDQREKQQRDTAQEPTSPGDGSQDGRPCHVTDGSGEYVKFSKGKFWLEPPSETQRKQLEEELKLSGTNLKSNAWYHGHIPWEVSESLVGKHGDFLIRDSQSSQGDFVLTCHWEEKTLHFLIRKTLVQSGETYTRVLHSLGGGAFDTLQALVHFYAGSRAALTPWSSAQIHQPVNRTLPLSYLETAFGTVPSLRSNQGGPRSGSTSGEERVRPRSPSSLHHRGTDMSRGQDDRTLSTSGESTLTSPNINTPRSRSPLYPPTAFVAPSPSFSRSLSTTQPTSSPSSTLNRQRNNRYHQNQDSPSPDADGSCYTELYPGPQSYVERLWAEDGSLGLDPLRLDDGNVYFSPVVEAASSFKPSRYKSPLMPEENKPLEVGILRRVKELLAEIDPRTAAKHITKADCMVARILEVTPEVQRMMGVSSGIELLTLPHGQQLRLDLLERFHTMAIMLAVDVLGCTGTNEERAGLLYKIIQIAAELKSTMGNMFGFAAVMRALELPQVSRLEQMWTALRQRHTEGAILYEKTLRPFMKSLNDGIESCPLSNTTFPHVLPLLSLLEKSVAVGEGTEPWETAEVGMDMVMLHLGAARTIAQLGGIYQSNAQGKLQGFQEQAEVLELFLTDFQLRLLWGSRGAPESQALRYTKFDQVLTALSNRLEPPFRSH
ncbi:LOW QUALITY PROTEIN: SH2 domain containing 3Cb [Hippoglossus hippoglossus]|uniref:LOW QUALITY PROTEIN: SH2 domain containing 3Cb n=1 Tax=Hippoglossus hippoglossus TaxID=8267 RepID=UPI00148C9CCA|nr:LOW QUALITY PROTEIN: SH2 domain containing 3Cb [Hippoglossus hippoglossus]